MRNWKKKLRNCHSPEETNRMWWLNAMGCPGWDPRTGKRCGGKTGGIQMKAANVGFLVLTKVPWQCKILTSAETEWRIFKISPCYLYHFSTNLGIVPKQKVYETTKNKSQKQYGQEKRKPRGFSVLCLIFTIVHGSPNPEQHTRPHTAFLIPMLSRNTPREWMKLSALRGTDRLPTLSPHHLSILFCCPKITQLEGTFSVLPPQIDEGISISDF